MHLSTTIGEQCRDYSQYARRVIAAAEAKAHEIGQPMNIAVVDSCGAAAGAAVFSSCAA
jgi:hypothetical protein